MWFLELEVVQTGAQRPLRTVAFKKISEGGEAGNCCSGTQDLLPVRDGT